MKPKRDMWRMSFSLISEHLIQALNIVKKKIKYNLSGDETDLEET